LLILTQVTPSNDTTTETIISLLTSMPISSSFSSLQLYQAKLLQWRREAEYYLSKSSAPCLPDTDEEETEVNDAYTSILKILTGDEEEIAIVADDWKSCIIAIGVYKYPKMQATDMGELLETLPEKFDLPDDIVSAFLKVFLSGFN
jgi:hypothetical protein